jgi:hypothetical protein
LTRRGPRRTRQRSQALVDARGGGGDDDGEDNNDGAISLRRYDSSCDRRRAATIIASSLDRRAALTISSSNRRPPTTLARVVRQSRDPMAATPAAPSFVRTVPALLPSPIMPSSNSVEVGHDEEGNADGVDSRRRRRRRRRWTTSPPVETAPGGAGTPRRPCVSRCSRSCQFVSSCSHVYVSLPPWTMSPLVQEAANPAIPAIIAIAVGRSSSPIPPIRHEGRSTHRCHHRRVVLASAAMWEGATMPVPSMVSSP